MHTFHSRAVDEDFPERARLRQIDDLARIHLEGEGRLRFALRVQLIEIRAQDGIDHVLEPAQDPVVIQAGDFLQRIVDFAFQAGCAERAVLAVGSGIEAQVEQVHQLGCNLRIIVERRPHVVFGKPDTRLPQIFGKRSHHGNIPPGEIRGKNEAVVAVVFGPVLPDGHEQALQPFLQVGGQIDLSAAARLKRHLVQIGKSPAGRGDPVGPFVDDLETHVFQKRHTGRKRDRRPLVIDLERQPCVFVTLIAEEGHRRIALFRQGFDLDHIGQGAFGVVDFLVAAVEGKRIAFGQMPGRDRIEPGPHRIAQAVRPGPDQIGDRAFQLLLGRRRRLALVSADDEMHARQRTFQIGHVPGRKPALVDSGKIGADIETHFGRVAVARHEAEDRDIAVELVDARQDPDSGTFVELQDRDREVEQGVLVDLEQLVAGKAFHNVDQRPARMAVRIVTGERQNAGNLAAQEGNRAGRFRIGRRREQADDAQLSDHRAVVIEDLGTDIVHMNPAVNPALHIGLGNDQRLRLQQELADFRRDLNEFGSPTQNPNIRIGQQTQARADMRREFAFFHTAFELVLPHAEEDEVVLRQPFQKVNRFPHLVVAAGDSRGLVGIDGLGEALLHRLEVPDRGTDIVENQIQPFFQRGSRLFGIHPRHVDMDETFLTVRALRLAFRQDGGLELSLFVSFHDIGRMQHKMDFKPAFLQFVHDRSDQERHVVVDDLDDGQFAGLLAGSVEIGIGYADPMRPQVV